MRNLITGNKTEEQLQAMREGGKILARILRELTEFSKVGITGLEVDAFARKKIKEYGAKSAYLTPEVNFPGVVCISLNDCVVHGAPNDIPFEKGDVVKYDMVIQYKGMMVDSATTTVVGEEPKGAVKHLLNDTKKALAAGISVVKPGVKTGDIGAAVEKSLKKSKLGNVRDLVGHGIGVKMHMDPEVPNYGHTGQGVVFQEGDTFCIEPMTSLGKGDVVFNGTDSKWDVLMRDGSLSAHFEHTILVTKDGAEILTLE